MLSWFNRHMFKGMMLHDNQCSDSHPPSLPCNQFLHIQLLSFHIFLFSFPVLFPSFPFQYPKIASLASQLRGRTSIGLLSTGLATASSVLEILVIAHGKIPFPIVLYKSTYELYL